MALRLRSICLSAFLPNSGCPNFARVVVGLHRKGLDRRRPWRRGASRSISLRSSTTFSCSYCLRGRFSAAALSWSEFSRRWYGVGPAHTYDESCRPLALSPSASSPAGRSSCTSAEPHTTPSTQPAPPSCQTAVADFLPHVRPIALFHPGVVVLLVGSRAGQLICLCRQ